MAPISNMSNDHSNGTDYNELLYAHLLDSEGNRLTYTHFTAKVHSGSLLNSAGFSNGCIWSRQFPAASSSLSLAKKGPCHSCSEPVGSS